MAFRVKELLDSLDLQTPVVVCDDGGDGDRFAEHVDPQHGSHSSGVLRDVSKRMGYQKVRNTDVDYDLSRSFGDGVEGSLWEGISRGSNDE